MAKIFSICLHRVSDEHSPAYPPMPVGVFERLMVYLKKRHGFLSLADLHDPEKIKKGGILLTFDDAYYDFYQHAFPVLKKLEIPVILNVITSCAETGESFWTQRLNKLVEAFYRDNRIRELSELSFYGKPVPEKASQEETALSIFRALLDGRQKDAAIAEMVEKLGYTPEYTRMMDWNEIREVSEHGVIIGSHTHQHKNLTLIQEQALLYELIHSAALIEQNIGQKPDIIAFPNGQHNEHTLAASSETHYKYALTVNNTSFSIVKDQNDIFVIPRINVYNRTFLKNWLKLKYYFIFK